MFSSPRREAKIFIAFNNNFDSGPNCNWLQQFGFSVLKLTIKRSKAQSFKLVAALNVLFIVNRRRAISIIQLISYYITHGLNGAQVSYHTCDMHQSGFEPGPNEG